MLGGEDVRRAGGEEGDVPQGCSLCPVPQRMGSCAVLRVCVIFPTSLPGWFLLEELYSSGFSSRGIGQLFLPLFGCSALVLGFSGKVIVTL